MKLCYKAKTKNKHTRFIPLDHEKRVLFYLVLTTVLSSVSYGSKAKVSSANKNYGNYAYVDAIQTYAHLIPAALIQPTGANVVVLGFKHDAWQFFLQAPEPDHVQ